MGSFSSIVTTGGQAADPDRVRWQQTTRNDPELRVAYAREILTQKISAMKETVLDHLPRSKYWQLSFDNICSHAERLKTQPPETISDILGIEGGVAADYFRAWRGVRLKWKSASKHPIPEEWTKYLSRSALRSTMPTSNRNATHPINAMLNYNYGMLVARTQIVLIAEGYNPMLGVIHDKRRRDRGRYPAFALDRMEPLRSVVDRSVLKLIREETFSGADFELQSDGAVRLNPELARLLAAG